MERPLIGFREWMAPGHIHRLLGLSGYFSGTWLPGEEAVARCQEFACTGYARTTHSPPLRDGRCGIHGFYDPMVSKTYRGQMVQGVIVGYGRIIEHELGFRAERAMLLCLYDGMRYDHAQPEWLDRELISETRWASRERQVARLAGLYGVPHFSKPGAIAFAGEAAEAWAERLASAAT